MGIRAQKFTDQMLKELIVEISEVSPLRYLFLAENRNITDKGTLFLEKLPQIEYLNLSACGITNDGLAFLPKMTALTYLNLSYCNRVSEGAARYTQPLRQLTLLDLKGVIRINTNGLKKFERRGLEIQKPR